MSLSDSLYCTDSGDGIIISVYIQPRASKNEICGIIENKIKIRLTSPPVDGAANKLCREFLADFFDLPKSDIDILSGESSRHKRIKIRRVDSARLNELLAKVSAGKNKKRGK